MNIKTLIRLSALVLVVVIFFACKAYYKANTVNPASSATSVDSLKKINRYFILRNGDEAYYMKNIELSTDQKTAQCVLETLPLEHLTHLTNGIKGKGEYKRTSPANMNVVNEVHFFMEKDKKAEIGNYTLQLDKVNRIEVLEHDKKRTTNSYVVGAVGYTLGSLAVVGLIILATKSSCPFVAAYDGNEFSLQGEIYGGSIYQQLSRLDYLPLKMAPMADGSLQLKITNELKEIQYTDFARLWKVNHSKDSKIMVDEKGNLLSISNPQAPVEALLNGKKKVMASLNKASDFNLIYMDDSSLVNARNEITMKFKKPAGANKGKLFLSLKNSYFLDLLYGELAKGFGTYYASYMNEQKKKSKEELLKWVKEQQLPLDVSVLTEKGWQNTTSITTIGPLAFRETAIEVDLSNVKTDEVEIKLGSGFMFWEIDYAAMDFTTDKNFSVEKMDPESATDETGKNVLPELINEDGNYLNQPSIGNSATIVFRSKSTGDASSAQTFILETKGYYEHIRDFKNKPDIKFLEQFKKPGAFPVYGMGLYKKIKKESLEGFAKSN
jgi:hypothetical protein